MGACFTIVDPDQLAALEFLGAFQQILGPGCHFTVPCANSVRKISTRVAENRIVTETKTKDNVFVVIHIAVQQEVRSEDCQAAIYKLNNPAQQIESFVSDVVRSHAPLVTLDALFEAKEEIAKEVKERLTIAMNAYGYNIHQVLVVDIAPDQKVKNAMNQINANRRLRQAAEEKAEADKIVLVKAAEAECESKFLAGQGMARSRAAIIKGLKDAVVGDGAKGKLQAKEVTELLLMTQYLDTLEKMSNGPATTVFMPHAQGANDISQQVRMGMLQAGAAK